MAVIAPFLPDTAPFPPEQRAWLNGYFASLAAGAPETLPLPGGDGMAAPPVVAPGTAPDVPRFDRASPFPARLLECRCLCGEGSDKDVRHVELSLEGSGLAYEPGDALGVVPRNDPALVEALVAALGASGDEPVAVGGDELPLREALAARLELGAPPRKLLEDAAARADDAALREMLDPERREELEEYLWGRDVLDVVETNPGLWTAAELCALLRPLQHRLYSIASCLEAHPGQVHLTVGVVRYEAHGRARGGACSTFLSDRAGETVPVFVHRNAGFRLPVDLAAPLVMIGPGTGVAPFRAFLHARRVAGATGPSWLFFGDRRAETDFLYRDELEAFAADGTLARLDTAFSRDQTEKVYVQHRMLEHAAELYAWLEDGAHLYVCGDASRMARDVDAALHRVVETAGGLGPEESAAYVRRLKREKRYARDVY